MYEMWIRTCVYLRYQCKMDEEGDGCGKGEVQWLENVDMFDDSSAFIYALRLKYLPTETA